MKTAHVNEEGIVLRYDPVENLRSQEWEILLDQLGSQPVPSLYQTGKRAHVAPDPATGQTCVTIYFTQSTVSTDQAIEILRHWDFEVHDVREEGINSDAGEQACH